LIKTDNSNLKKEITELNKIILSLKNEYSELNLDKNNISNVIIALKKDISTSNVDALNFQVNELNKEINNLKENPAENLIDYVYKKVECDEIVSFINSTQFQEILLTICPQDYKKKIEKEIIGIVSKFKLEISSKISKAINDLEEELNSKLVICIENIEKITLQLKSVNFPLDVIEHSVKVLTDYQKKLTEKIESLKSLKQKFQYNTSDF